MDGYVLCQKRVLIILRWYTKHANFKLMVQDPVNVIQGTIKEDTHYRPEFLWKYSITPEYPTHPTSLGLGLGIRLGLGLGIGLGLEIRDRD